jgi:hypothetical protein
MKSHEKHEIREGIDLSSSRKLFPATGRTPQDQNPLSKYLLTPDLELKPKGDAPGTKSKLLITNFCRMNATVKLRLIDGSMEIAGTHIPVDEPHINVGERIRNEKQTLLFERKHTYIQSQFVLPETATGWLLTFDESKNFVTALPHFYRGGGSFSIMIPEPYVLLLPNNHGIKFEEIVAMDFSISGKEGSDDL